ncbi:MAG: hypothetical protein L0H31_15065, partial [Nocardioidaceae bacterium]|nr:hypothetical protein [Nocardioidaceae bacterium]
MRALLLEMYSPQRTALLLESRRSWLTLLTELVTDNEQLTHASLDCRPQTGRTRYLRRLLIAIEVLPSRDNTVDDLDSWIDTLLADQPPHIAVVLQPYATWHVIHRLRRLRG